MAFSDFARTSSSETIIRLPPLTPSSTNGVGDANDDGWVLLLGTPVGLAPVHPATISATIVTISATQATPGRGR
ncbi:hypothetical protein GCM10007298_25620 [Williamsia phyllosphaerae]|uniref:Uncharacterized protein n=1 Tax=Williamsia phyllosphaerae TaxID=885042 RepID=A0ABQ1UWC2_9NOCA|nr:hypothetical protein GCM10007298_25620 [Williamsia phyllosphaerae]